MMLPRRYRNIIIKLSVILLLLWLGVRLFLNSDSVANNTSEIHKKEQNHHKPESQPRVDLLHNSNRLDKKHDEDGFGDYFVDSKFGDNKKVSEEKGVLVPPHNPDGPGERGKPVKIENPSSDVKQKIDKGWQDNAFNQYVSDMISVHRT